MSEYGKDPAAYVEKQSEDTQALLAFAKYIETGEGRILNALIREGASVVLTSDLLKIFEAGWKAARTS